MGRTYRVVKVNVLLQTDGLVGLTEVCIWTSSDATAYDVYRLTAIPSADQARLHQPPNQNENAADQNDYSENQSKTYALHRLLNL